MRKSPIPTLDLLPFALPALLLVLLSACSTGNRQSPSGASLAVTPDSMAASGAFTFRSETNHLEIDVPPGWAASEGPEELTRYDVGLVSFNSWGEPGFWAREVETRTGQSVSRSYNPEVVLEQMPPGGAYVVLFHFARYILSENYGPEYTGQSLSGLWAGGDCRKGDVQPGVTSLSFQKWGRSLFLQVYCDPQASDETAWTVNNLLTSWRFDEIPVGDPGWAVLLARQRLPDTVQPDHFPIVTDLRKGSSEIGDVLSGVSWSTQVEAQGDTVEVTFRYVWDHPPEADWTSGECPPERCHWWHFEARPGGAVGLAEEGGAPLPDE